MFAILYYLLFVMHGLIIAFTYSQGRAELENNEWRRAELEARS